MYSQLLNKVRWCWKFEASPGNIVRPCLVNDSKGRHILETSFACLDPVFATYFCFYTCLYYKNSNSLYLWHLLGFSDLGSFSSVANNADASKLVLKQIILLLTRASFFFF